MTDILVVGGGALGMLSARELRLAGAQVRLLERGRCGLESSWAGGGILSPLHPWRYADAISQLARWSQARYAGLCAELEETTGMSPQWQQNGMLLLEPDVSEVEQAQDWARRFDARLSLQDSAAIAELEPELKPALKSALKPELAPGLEPGPQSGPAGQALWMDQIAQVRNPRLLKALRAEIERLGVQVQEQTPMLSLLRQGDRLSGVLTPTGPIKAQQVVLCAGAWSADLLGDTLPRPEIKPVRGQMILFRARPGLVRRISLFDGHYCIPRQDGRVLMGSTLESVGYDRSTTEQARTELWSRACRRFPALRDCPVERHWAGLRPAAPEGIPYIGEHPSLAGLYINAGHYRNGLVLAPASARLLADVVLGRQPILDPTPYALKARPGSGA